MDRKSDNCRSIGKIELGKTTSEEDQGKTNEFLGAHYQKRKD